MKHCGNFIGSLESASLLRISYTRKLTFDSWWKPLNIRKFLPTEFVKKAQKFVHVTCLPFETSYTFLLTQAQEMKIRVSGQR